MITRQALVSLVALGAVSLVTACSNTETGSPSAAESSSASAEVSGSTPIPEQLDIEPFLSRPCDVVSSSTLQSLGYEAEGDEGLPGSDSVEQEIAGLAGPYCGWYAAGDESRVLTVTLLSSDSTQGEDALEYARSLHSEELLQLWEETSVSGYPAAYWGIQDNRSRGDCSLMASLSEKAFFSVSASLYLDNPGDACVHAGQVAQDVIRSIKEEV